MSGSSMVPWGLHSAEDAEGLAMQLGKLLTKLSYPKDTLLHHLYNVSAHDIVMASEKLSSAIPSFRPTIENPAIAEEAFLSMCAVKKYASGDFSKVPHIMGFTEKEMVTFAGCAFQKY